MPTKIQHHVSIAGLPRRLQTGGARVKSLSLSWNSAELKKRVQFVLGLLCHHPSSVAIQFVDPVEMGSLNWQFRGKGSATDVLSFVPHTSTRAAEQHGSGLRKAALHFGDLAVCTEVCEEQSRRHRCTLAAELERMIVHGLVHLRGFDHERSTSAESVMSALERSLRQELKRTFGEPKFCMPSSDATAARKRREKR